jgi:transposase
MGGHRRSLLESVAEAISTRIAAKADWTVRALAADLQTDGIKVSHDTTWRYLRSQGLRF